MKERVKPYQFVNPKILFTVVNIMLTHFISEINEMKDVVTKLGGRLPSSVERPI